MATTKTPAPPPRSLQEWMERTQTSGVQLCELLKKQTGRTISPTLLSFILRGSRRCSAVNAEALNAVTGVSYETLTEWPKISQHAKFSGKRPNRAA